MDKIPVWQMVKEAVEHLGGKGDYAAIKRYINGKWENVNENTINAQLISLSVNQRVHYPNNKKPRFSNGPYDLLFSIGSGQVVRYDPKEHGLWEIYEKEYAGPTVRQVIETEGSDEEIPTEGQRSFLFPIEANLRDFLIRNLQTVKDHKLQLYIDPSGRDGKEYPTEVGPIDILAVDESGNFVVFELKLSRGADKALGQLLRYMGYVRLSLAKGKSVKGIIVANRMDTKIKYAVSMTPDIALYEYELKFELTKPAAIESVAP